MEDTDAQELYRQGVAAISHHNDLARGRDLLVASLKLNPHNDMAWMWLTRTTTSPERRLELVERALRANPANEAALKLRAQLLAQRPTPPPAPSPLAAPAPAVSAEPHLVPPESGVIQPLKRKTVEEPVSPAEKERIARLVDRAEIYREAGEIEQAIALWVEVLAIRVDHELALRNAAGHLWKLQYWQDAKELVQRAIDAGTRVPTVYLTALDMAERQSDGIWAAELRERVASLPVADEQLVVKVAEYYLSRRDQAIALQFLERALETHPAMPVALIKLGDLLHESGDRVGATRLYERAARLGTRGKTRKEVDKKLRSFVPVLTDRERGSVWLALREAAGIAGLFVFLGWQDARLDLLALGPRRWLGVLVSLLGGYLLVTATSSPQQRPLAGWLGGSVPPPPPPEPPRLPGDPAPFRAPGRALQEPTALPILPAGLRYVLGALGLALLGIAFALVFYYTLGWVGDNRPPYLPW
jgi:tetratricopeptide (TPR) repeat protein